MTRKVIFYVLHTLLSFITLLPVCFFSLSEHTLQYLWGLSFLEISGILEGNWLAEVWTRLVDGIGWLHPASPAFSTSTFPRAYDKSDSVFFAALHFFEYIHLQGPWQTNERTALSTIWGSSIEWILIVHLVNSVNARLVSVIILVSNLVSPMSFRPLLSLTVEIVARWCIGKHSRFSTADSF